MSWREFMPEDVRLGIERFHAAQVEGKKSDRELIAAALREFLIAHGYLKFEDVEEEPGGGTARATSPSKS